MFLIKELLTAIFGIIAALFKVLITIVFFGVIIALMVSFPLQVIAFAVVFLVLFGRR